MMGKVRFTVSWILVLILTMTAGHAFAAAGLELQNSCASALAGLGIMTADSKGNVKVKEKMKRYEFILLVNKTMSFDTDTDPTGVELSFKDLTEKHKAYRDVQIAVRQGYLSAEDESFRPNAVITYIEAQEMLLKALGYGNDIEGADIAGIMDKAAVLGLSTDLLLPSNRQMTRGEAAVLLYNSLTVNFNQ